MFDPLKVVTATDKEDGTITLTKDNIIVNDFDTSKADTYHVTYKVIDRNGATTENTITVLTDFILCFHPLTRPPLVSHVTFSPSICHIYYS